jgi:chloramphenicol-sensitive protein RarD
VLAFCGVTILTVNYGTVPWIALVIAFSFALYGLTKKIINIEPITSLILESSIMSIFALIYLFHLHNHHLGSFGNAEISITLLLLGPALLLLYR